MSDTPRVTVTTAPRPEWLVVKALDPVKLTVTSRLTIPEKDLDGDIVVPGGCRWDDSRLVVDIDHDPQKVVGRGTVVMKADPDYSDPRLLLPHGTTHFSRNALGVQAFELVRAGIMTGVSIEFLPITKKAIGPSLTRGVAYRYEDYHLRGWTHCLNCPPVQQGAKVLPETVGKALDILNAGKIGNDPLQPIIRKALSVYRDYPRPASVSVPRQVVKAMDDQYPDPTAAPPVDAMPPADVPPEDDGTTPTAKVGYDLAQGLADLIARSRDELKKGEHVKGKAKLTKELDDLEARIAKVSAIADGVVSDVGGADGNPATPDTDEDAEPDADESGGESDADADDTIPKARTLKKAADGMIVTPTGYQPTRLGVYKAGSFAPLAPARPRAAGQDADALLAEAARNLEARLNGTPPGRRR